MEATMSGRLCTVRVGRGGVEDGEGYKKEGAMVGSLGLVRVVRMDT